MADQSPGRQLRGFLAKFNPGVARVASRARAKLSKLLPGFGELVSDNHNALAIDFGPTVRASAALKSIAVFPRRVSVFFMRGAQLPDPHKLLRGNGRQARHMMLEDPETQDAPGCQGVGPGCGGDPSQTGELGEEVES